MVLENFSLIAVIAIFSVVQSVFGVGVLVFGTPTLLLMGYDFIATLGYLLPASVAISLLQVLFAGTDRTKISKDLYLICLPGIGIGLWMTGNSVLASWTNAMVGLTLVLSALIRCWLPSRALLTKVLRGNSRSYHLVMGVVHGLTNLGGAMLTVLAGTQHAEKQAIRYTVAHYYLAFGIIQMLVLALTMRQHEVLMNNLPVAGISAAVYLLFGNRVFVRTSDRIYNTALTIFIAAYGILVLVRL